MNVTSPAWDKWVLGPQKKLLHLSTSAYLYILSNDPCINANKHMTLFFPKVNRHRDFCHVGSL